MVRMLLLLVLALSTAACASDVSPNEAAESSTSISVAVPSTVWPTATEATPSTTEATTTTTFAASRSTTTATLPPIDKVEAGLFCRDLAALGYGYVEAVAYWIEEGSPDRMDADRNGIPCETIYSSSEVLEYWGDPLPVVLQNQFASVVAIDPGPPIAIVADYAEWLWGDEAERACREDGQDPDCPYEGLYYIRNQNPRLRTLQVANDARVFLAHPTHTDAVACTPVSEDVMADVGFDPHPTDGCEIPGKALPLVWPELIPGVDEWGRLVWLIVEGDVVVAIQEQYTP